MLKQHLSIISTHFPLDYDKNNPVEGFCEWREYVHSEVYKDLGGPDKLAIEAARIVTPMPSVKPSQRRVPTREEMIKGDRIIVAMIFITVFILAMIITIVNP